MHVCLNFFVRKWSILLHRIIWGAFVGENESFGSWGQLLAQFASSPQRDDHMISSAALLK